MNTEYQQSIVQAIETIVRQMIKDTPYTTSKVGIVMKIEGLECSVKIYDKEEKCYLFEHMVGQVWVGDIVVVQDLYNDGSSKYVLSRIAVGQS